ncbi:hypothetical protein LTR57_025529 [Friedmanniomyces endolithicus]|nr:hypothetical protein LTR57_025529 [Friedmanniomyces endolithicus]
MVNQHAKWLEKCADVSWRQQVSSLNILLTSTVWRQDHNGFTHQDPGFLDVVANKSPEVVRIYLPPDGNCLLSVMDHCFRSTNYVNTIVADKQLHLQYLNMDDAIAHCTKGLGIWPWASNDAGAEPDLVMASCGDVVTQEALAATALLRQHLPELKSASSMSSTYSNSCRTNTTLTIPRRRIFNFHSYPWLVHRLTYQREGQQLMHVRGYREKGNIDTPLELAIRNGTDRFGLAVLAVLAIDCLKGVLGNRGSTARERFEKEKIDSMAYAYETGLDPEDFTGWTWPF